MSLILEISLIWLALAGLITGLLLILSARHVVDTNSKTRDSKWTRVWYTSPVNQAAQPALQDYDDEDEEQQDHTC